MINPSKKINWNEVLNSKTSRALAQLEHMKDWRRENPQLGQNPYCPYLTIAIMDLENMLDQEYPGMWDSNLKVD